MPVLVVCSGPIRARARGQDTITSRPECLSESRYSHSVWWAQASTCSSPSHLDADGDARTSCSGGLSSGPPMTVRSKLRRQMSSCILLLSFCSSRELCGIGERHGRRCGDIYRVTLVTSHCDNPSIFPIQNVKPRVKLKAALKNLDLLASTLEH